jgi:hypothetical protein
MERTLSNYIGATLIGILLINTICCMSILLFQTPTRDDLFLFVWFDMIISIMISGLIYNSLIKIRPFSN